MDSVEKLLPRSWHLEFSVDSQEFRLFQGQQPGSELKSSTDSDMLPATILWRIRSRKAFGHYSHSYVRFAWLRPGNYLETRRIPSVVKRIHTFEGTERERPR